MSLDATSARSASQPALRTPPSRLIDSCPAAELSAKTSAPVRRLHAVGVYETWTWQKALTASGFGAIGQSDATTEKSPVAVMELIRVGPVPPPKMRSLSGPLVAPRAGMPMNSVSAGSTSAGLPDGVVIPCPNSHVSV